MAGRGVAALEGGLGMILANVRGRLRMPDFRLVALALARGDARRRARYEQLLLEQGPDPLLDEPGLLEALLALRTLAVPSPPLFAYVAVRHALRAAAVDDRELADYLAALLLEFGDHDRHTRIRRADDETYGYLVDIVEDLTALDDTGERGLLLRVHLGNYSLWFAGLFPDFIEARRTRKGGPDLPYYDAVGRQGYRLASEHRLAERFGVASIYRSAAERCPTLRVAFNRLSDRVFFRHVTTPEKILRNLCPASFIQEPRRQGRRGLHELLRRFHEPHHDRQRALERQLTLHDPGDGAELLAEDALPVRIVPRDHERRPLRFAL